MGQETGKQQLSSPLPLSAPRGTALPPLKIIPTPSRSLRQAERANRRAGVSERGADSTAVCSELWSAFHELYCSPEAEISTYAFNKKENHLFGQF